VRRNRPTPAPPDRPWSRRSILFAVLALAACLAWRTECSRDFGFHLATGRWILEHGAWPRVDSFTYTRAASPYIDMHGLFQVVLALAYRGGMVGVGLLRLAFVLATIAILWASARQRGVRSAALLGLGFGIALLAWEVRLMTRPELASGLCLAAQLLLLRRHADSGRRRWLYATVPLQWVWVYSHALSVFGIVVLGLYAAASLIGGLRRRVVDASPWLALAGATAVMFLNPYGAGGVAFLWNLQSRIQPGNTFAESIQELMSPFSARAAGFHALRAFKFMLIAGGGVVLARARRTALFDLGLLALFGTLAAMHMRMVGLFAIAALPVALEAACGLGRSLPAPWRMRFAGAGALATVAVLLALVFVCEQTVADGYYTMNRSPSRFGYGESPAIFPIGTVATLNRGGLGGRIFNSIEFGGYLCLHRYPREQAFIDGRLEVMGEDFFDLYSRASDGGGWDEIVARYRPEVALVSATRSELIQRLRGDPGWTLVDVDAVSVLFARDTPDHRAAIAAGMEHLRRLNAAAAATDEAIVPPPPPAWPAVIFGPHRVSLDDWGRGTSFLQLGMLQAARRAFRQTLLAADQPEPALVKAYVVVTYQLGRFAESRAWCRRLVEISPRDAQARGLLVDLESR
jgi:hypothetical protein